ncbi:histidine phosphatase superfamily [Crassisporium funariophilum]|nr:histidine phosphatase superfamily [Crassisporium funariophilum]
MSLGNKLPRFIFLSALVTLFSCNTICAQNCPELLEICDTPSIIILPGMTNTPSRTGTSQTSSKGSGYRYPQLPLEVDGYAVAPENLELEQVHVYVRHGERTPVGVRLSGPPASIPEHWNMCKTARRFHASTPNVSGDQNQKIPHVSGVDRNVHTNLPTRKVVERKDGTIAEGDCLLGELTDLGRQSTFDFGNNLRRLYIDRLGFLPDTLPDERHVYFRTTNMPRTTESLQHIIHGLYPTNKCHPSVFPAILIRNGKDENLIGNTYACKRLEILQVGFATAAAAAYNHTLEPLDKKVSKYLDGNPIRVDGKPRASGVMDTVRSAIAHGIKVPAEFEDKAIVDVIEQAVVNEWFADKTEEVRRLAMGRLLEELSNKMQRKAERGNTEPLKILVHSTHDTAIAGLCSTLDVFDEKWPAFTASVTFELFKKKALASQSTFPQSILSRFGTSSASPRHYVRMRYQNKDMVLKTCAEPGKHLEGHPEFCTFAAFQERVKELTPTNWDVECSPSGRG